jgi:G3E family GTPase
VKSGRGKVYPEQMVIEENTTTSTGVPEGNGPARYVMIGGFLGAGKTTAVGKLGEFLKKRGLKVGIITNGQGKELVDTAMLRARGFPTEQIWGGCFGGQFEALTDAAQKLADADVIIAEPLGSCTDLVATVSSPLREIHGNRYMIAPFSVMVDPVLAARMFGLESGGKFSEKVAYVYRKQIEEADIVVINKSDLISEEKLARLKKLLEQHAVEATVFTVSGLTGIGLEEWFDCLMRKNHSGRPPMQIDYNVYGEAEALLGWLNCTVRLSSVKYFDSSKVLNELAVGIQSLLQQEGSEIGHLKMTLGADEDSGAIAVLNLVRNDHVPEFSQQLPEPIQSGEMLLNLRAEADPEILHSAVNRALLALVEKSPHLFARMEQCEHFRPGKPQPTRRVAVAS